MKYAIKHKNGTYFSEWSYLGPCFGSTKENARKFDTEKDAQVYASQHFGFVSTEIVPVTEEGNEKT